MTSSLVDPPADQTTRRMIIRGLLTVGLVIALGGDGLRNAFGLTASLVISAIVAVLFVVVIVIERPLWRGHRAPVALVAYLCLALASLLWSEYPSASAVALLGTLATTLLGYSLATLLSWSEILTALSRSITVILLSSFAFELWVSLVVRHPLLPHDYAGAPEDATPMAMWSRNLLLSGDRIQGVLGNSNLLGIVALLGIIVALVRLWREGSRPSVITLLVAAAAAFAMTRSATATVAAFATLIVVAVALWMRAASTATRATRRGFIGVSAILLTVVLAVALWPRLLGLLGRSDDLTGRAGIWETVIALGQQHPILGNGFATPWVPWVEPFDDLVIQHGVVQLQAHNAWLDVWMQLGSVGVIVFGALVLGAAWRSWFAATDRPRIDATTTVPFAEISVLPLAILVALSTQSLTESRLLVESGWVLLTMISIKTIRSPQILPEPVAARPPVGARA